jgi:hypothetical protein
MGIEGHLVHLLLHLVVVVELARELILLLPVRGFILLRGRPGGGLSVIAAWNDLLYIV